MSAMEWSCVDVHQEAQRRKKALMQSPAEPHLPTEPHSQKPHQTRIIVSISTSIPKKKCQHRQKMTVVM
jgi:hypothetical protein